MGCGREKTEEYPRCNMGLGARHQQNDFCSTSHESIIPLTVAVILQPKRANSFIVGGRLLTMRSISSPPLVGPRLGLTRDSTGPASATCSSTGAADVGKDPCWPAGSDSLLAGGPDADTSTVGLCAGEGRDCTRPGRRSSPAEVPEVLAPNVHRLEISPEVQSKPLYVA